ncbi:MAG: peptide chain release factor N(5)-glutamine methyltransferase [Gemmatimonadota bacterium]|nr:MAG: peptide chain release factor N(5)-glutamine methyltransferase [Gemmatimonadota bacterium]
MLECRLVGAVLAEATDSLKRANIADARREALTIWASLAGLDIGQVWLLQQETADAPMVERFGRALARRLAGEPFAYVVGTAGFRTLDLAVDSRVLIPRPETEGLVERVLAWSARRWTGGVGSWGTVVDVGTGSGCVALSLAAEGRFRRVLATDTAAAALDVARHNYETVAPGTPVEFHLGAGLDPVHDAEPDVIVSNPPYLTAAEFAALDRCVRDYEPRAALVGGSDGMEQISALLFDAMDVLAAGGLLAIEIDSSRADLAWRLAREAGWHSARVEADLFARQRYLLATKES